MTSTPARTTLLTESCVILTASVATALLVHGDHYHTPALTWPAVDNLPAVCQRLWPECLKEDFFASASAEDNPRTSYVVLLTLLTGWMKAGLGGGLTLMKTLLLLTLPAATTTFLILASRRLMSDIWSPVVLIWSAAMAMSWVYLMQGEVGLSLSVAWWRPLGFDPTTHNLGLLLALTGCCLAGRPWAGVPLIVAGTWFHPAMGLFTVAMAVIVSVRTDEVRQSVIRSVRLLAPALLTALVVQSIYAPETTLTTSEFVRIYVNEGHPSHYLVSAFGTFTDYPWWWSFLGVALGLSLLSVLLWHSGSPAWFNAVMAVLAYCGAVLLQYLLVELYPTRIFAALGPSRFTGFGGWFLGLFLMIWLLHLAHRQNWLLNVDWLRFVRVWQPMLLILILVMGGMRYNVVGNRMGGVSTADRQLIDFASEVPTDDVFILPFGNIRFTLPILARRATFFGNGFPFSEDHFLEHVRRQTLVDGDPEALRKLDGHWVGARYRQFYNSLPSSAFMKMADTARIDWVVISSGHQHSFEPCNPDFSSGSYRVFSITTLRHCSQP